MNAAVARLLLRGGAAGNGPRLALTVAGIALGVALGVAVHTLHASALAEIDAAARVLAGRADVEIRGPRSGFDDALFAVLARRPEVQVASPVVDLDAPLAKGATIRGPSGGAVTLRVLGIDPFRAMRLQPGFVAGAAAGYAASAGFLDRHNAWLTPPALARLGLQKGDAFRLGSGTGEVELVVAGALPALEGGGEVAVIDIAAAQERFGRVGKLSRIDIRLRPGIDPGVFRASLAGVLPAGVVAAPPASIGARAATLTRAYRVNLNALALVALLTGMFLAFSTLALQAARRREEFALLRALGLTRRGLIGLLALEGVLVGAIAAALGVALGLVASRMLLQEFGADLGAGYFRGLESTFAPDPLALAAIAALGVGAAALGAVVVARSAARQDVAAALRERVLDLPQARGAGILPAVATVVAGAALLALPPLEGLPIGGYLAIASWLTASVLAVGPACRGLLAHVSPEAPEAALAVAQVRHLPGHLAASVAGIVVSASLCVAMAVMVHSFRVSLDRWLDGVVGADLYARAALNGDTGYFTLEEEQRAARLPGIARLEPIRFDRLVLEADGAPLTLVARPLDERTLAGFQATPASGKPVDGAVAVWASEAAVDLHGWRTGSLITLPLAGKPTRAVVAGVYRDYARTWGGMLMDLGDYRRITGDTGSNDWALHLADRTRSAESVAALRAQFPEARGLVIEDASGIHRRSLEIFDRTFAATYALEAVAILIALVGVTSSFAAIAWSRRREFGILRYLGLTRGGILGMLTLEGAAAGALGAAIGLLSGSAISLVLIHVVNRQSFHWGMEVHWPLAGLAALASAIVGLCALGARWSASAAVRDEAVRAVKDDA